MSLSSRVAHLEQLAMPDTLPVISLGFPTEQAYEEAMRAAETHGTPLGGQPARLVRVYVGVDLEAV